MAALRQADLSASAPDVRDEPARAPRGLVDLVTLEAPWLTAAFWIAIALYVAAWWTTPCPPLVDYPQHVAEGAILHRLWTEPRGFDAGLYEYDLVTYNGGFHVALALLSYVVRPEIAGKILLSVYPVALGTATLALVRVAGRPRWYALLAVPATLSFVVGWGFANYFMSVPLALLTFTWWLRGMRGERGMTWRVWLASLVLAYSHVFCTMLLCAAIGFASLAMFRDLGRTWWRRLLALAERPLDVWPAIAWCFYVSRHYRDSPHKSTWVPWDDGRDDPLWYKVLHLTSYSVGNFADDVGWQLGRFSVDRLYSDQLLFALAVAVGILLWQHPRRTTLAAPIFGVLATCFFGLYFLVPKVVLSTWFMFERFPPWFVALGVAAIPLVPGSATRAHRIAAAVLAIAAGANTVFHLANIPGAADASAILDEIPAGSRVVAVTWSNHGEPVILREMWVHQLAYFLARRPGVIGYSFARFESLPVHYQPDRVPPVVEGGLEWDANKYDPASAWARHYDLVLVRTPDDAAAQDPRLVTFDTDAPRVRVRAHRGRFWLLDASQLFSRARPTTVDDAP